MFSFCFRDGRGFAKDNTLAEEWLKRRDDALRVAQMPGSPHGSRGSAGSDGSLADAMAGEGIGDGSRPPSRASSVGSKHGRDADDDTAVFLGGST